MATNGAASRPRFGLQKMCRSVVRTVKGLPHRTIAKTSTDNTSIRDRDLYQPLDKDRLEIRLLLVKAGRGSDEICCELQQAFLTSEPKPRYETISYCWGNPKKIGYIILNGKRTKVPASSKAAIIRMRFPDADRILWIDAVCINQNDPTERGHQVGLMAKVYSTGERNLIYLGEGDSTTPNAIEIIKKVLENAREETNIFEKWNELLLNSSGEYIYSKTEIGLDCDFKPLLSFFRAPWFERLWVTQEAVLSRTNSCYYGPSEVALEDVLRTARWLNYKRLSVPFIIANQRNMWNAVDLYFIYNTGNRAPLTAREVSLCMLGILHCLQNFEVTDPKDRIYAILGLHENLNSTSALAELMAPDYQYSLRSIIQDAAKFSIRERNDLCVLNDIDRFPLPTATNEPWPSWVPHWNLVDDDDLIPTALTGHNNADGSTMLDVDLALSNTNCNQLMLAGHFVSTALAVSSVANEYLLSRRNKTVILIDQIRSMLSIHSLTDLRPIGATLIAGKIHDYEHASEEDYDGFTTWTSYIDNRMELPPLLSDVMRTRDSHDTDTIRAAEYHFAVWNGLRNRRFFVTPDGFMGVGPRTMRSQDVIAVLYGCWWPVILRRQGEHYNILGTCYVHGIMDGEIVRKYQSEGREAEIFIIE